MAETASVPRITLDAVIMAVTDGTPKLLTVVDEGRLYGLPSGDRVHGLPSGDRVPRLPSGELGQGDEKLDGTVREFVRAQAGVAVGYVEQLYTFGDLDRRPAGAAARLLSIAYLALVREVSPSSDAAWLSFYDLCPWEDHRRGRPAAITERIEPVLVEWIAAATTGRVAREERAHVCFGFGGAGWDGARVLERYELLWELGLLDESPTAAARGLGRPMRLDHRRIVATAFGRLRGKLTYRPVVFELLPPTFTLLQLQRLTEALAGVKLHKQNFRRLVDAGGLVEGTGLQAASGGRPAELFRFRREVIRERPRPGFGVPWTRSS